MTDDNRLPLTQYTPYPHVQSKQTIVNFLGLEHDDAGERIASIDFIWPITAGGRRGAYQRLLRGAGPPHSVTTIGGAIMTVPYTISAAPRQRLQAWLEVNGFTVATHRRREFVPVPRPGKTTMK